MTAILSAMLCHWSIKVFICTEKCFQKLALYSDIPHRILTSSFKLTEKKQADLSTTMHKSGTSSSSSRVAFSKLRNIQPSCSFLNDYDACNI
jgi:hypothetical protein